MVKILIVAAEPFRSSAAKQCCPPKPSSHWKIHWGLHLQSSPDALWGASPSSRDRATLNAEPGAQGSTFCACAWSNCSSSPSTRESVFFWLNLVAAAGDRDSTVLTLQWAEDAQTGPSTAVERQQRDQLGREDRRAAAAAEHDCTMAQTRFFPAGAEPPPAARGDHRIIES